MVDVNQEVYVGSYRCDIVAKDETSQIEDAIEGIDEKTKENKQKNKRLSLSLKYINNTIDELDKMLFDRVGGVESKAMLLKEKTSNILKIDKNESKNIDD